WWDHYRRGFVEGATCPSVALFQREAPRLRAAAPLLSLGLNVADYFRSFEKADALAGLRSLFAFGQRLGDPAVRSLARSPHLADLNELSLQALQATADGVAALAGSPHLAALTSLSLSLAGYLGNLGPVCGHVLAASPHLTRLTS